MQPSNGTWAPDDALVFAPEVRDALASGLPVVALESTIISHGLPRPRNIEVALELEQVVRSQGAVPATIAVLGGRATIGLSEAQVEHVATASAVRKLAARDLPLALACGVDGATTVSATSHLAARAGVRVFATGGLGGVHRGWIESWDESADLDTLSRTRIAVVSAGVKSILDVPATLQRFETLNIAVVSFRSDAFPGFYLRDSGEPSSWRVDDESTIVDIMCWQDRLCVPGALVVANPIAAAAELDRELHDRVLAEGLTAAERERVGGQDLTPFLLNYMVKGTDGASLEANLAAVRANVGLGARIALGWSKR